MGPARSRRTRKAVAWMQTAWPVSVTSRGCSVSAIFQFWAVSDLGGPDGFTSGMGRRWGIRGERCLMWRVGTGCVARQTARRRGGSAWEVASWIQGHSFDLGGYDWGIALGR